MEALRREFWILWHYTKVLNYCSNNAWAIMGGLRLSNIWNQQMHLYGCNFSKGIHISLGLMGVKQLLALSSVENGQDIRNVLKPRLFVKRIASLKLLRNSQILANDFWSFLKVFFINYFNRIHIYYFLSVFISKLFILQLVWTKL